MAELSAPFGVAYPVRFFSGGDTTKDAFGKHIQEIERIYGFLNALNNGKASSSEIAKAISEHVEDEDPHPNWKPSISFDDIDGNIAASKVKGKLTNATIDSSRVNGLADFVDGRIPEIPEDRGDGITESQLEDSGYVKFNNGLILQWGCATVSIEDYRKTKESPHSHSFPVAFPNKCFALTVGTEADIDDSQSGHVDNVIQVKNVTASGFKYVIQEFYSGAYIDWTNIHCNYIAVGC